VSKYAQGKFQLTNPAKYAGNKVPTYRSSWEFVFMTFCDTNPNVLQWASEAIHIAYRNPLTGKNTIYVPDFLITYIDAAGKQHAEIIEVKPTKETTLEAAGKSPRAQAAAILNMAKWQAARAWCKAHNLTFRVVTEQDIFHMGGGRK
jgi:TnsA endonuclease N terminal